MAAAKVKTGEAACSGAFVAHQLHGAIGVTDEYLLHHSTMRLWSWRGEYGNEAQWAQKLGADALERGPLGAHHRGLTASTAGTRRDSRRTRAVQRNPKNERMARMTTIRPMM